VVQLGQNFSNSTRVKNFRELGQNLIAETVLALNQIFVQPLRSTTSTTLDNFNASS